MYIPSSVCVYVFLSSVLIFLIMVGGDDVVGVDEVKLLVEVVVEPVMPVLV